VSVDIISLQSVYFNHGKREAEQWSNTSKLEDIKRKRFENYRFGLHAH
jgi:hypothetical protein